MAFTLADAIIRIIPNTALLRPAITREAGAAGKEAAAISKRALLPLAVTITAVTAASIKMAADFESNTTRLITSAGETHANIDLVRRGMLEMAGQVGSSALDLSKAMYTVESGGRHGAEGLQVLRAAAEGAKTEGANLTVVADALTSVLQDYHLKGKDAALITSQMVAAVGAGKTTFEQFSGSLHSVLPIAASAHISFVDIAAAVASMTVHGVSAEQATQNLADTIKHLLAPTTVQIKELGQLGLSASDLANMVGKRGLTGTLQDLSQTILAHMGPSGRVLTSAFNQSRDAANSAQAMIAAMPPNLRTLAVEFQKGQISMKDWRATIRELPAPQANLMAQFAALQNRAHGFSDVLKSGGPAAQTYQDALRRVTGDATGLNVALQLTGENTAYVNQTIKTVGAATTEAGGHVKGWADIQSTFNQRLSQFKSALSAAAVELGTALLPAAKDVLTAVASSVTWFTKHTGAAKALGVAIGGLAAIMVAYRTYVLLAAAAEKAAGVAALVWRGAWLLGNTTLGIRIGLLALDAGAWARSTAATVANTVANGVNRAVAATRNAVTAAFVAVKNLEVVAWVRTTAATVASTAAMVAQRAVMLVVRGATIAWTAAQWLLNVALTANPIGIVIVAIAALVAAIVIAWTHSRTFRVIVEAVWHGILIAIKAVVSWFTGTIVPSFKKAVNDVSGFFRGLWTFLQTVWKGIRLLITAEWTGIKAVFNVIKTWVTVIIPTAFRTFLAIGQTVWRTLGAFVRAIWDSIRTGSFAPLRNFITQTLPGAFRSGVAAITNAWNRVKEAARVPVAFVVNHVINPLINGFNRVAGVFGIHGASTISGFDQGGWTGPGHKMMPAGIVHADEFVVRKESRRKVEGEHPGLLDHLNKFGTLPGYASGGVVGAIGSFFGKVWNGIKGVASSVASVLTNPAAALTKAANAAVGAIPGGGAFRSILVSLARRLVSGVGSWLTGHIFGGGGAGGGAAFAGRAPSGQLRSWIMQAIALTGVPASWAGPLNVLIGRESGGRPRAINLTDSNARAGHPSKGLMQTIPSTFAHYRLRSLPNDIYNPVANIVAGIRYILARYGSIFRVQQANPNLPPKGYESGGMVGAVRSMRLANMAVADSGRLSLQPGWNLVGNGTGAREDLSTGGGLTVQINNSVIASERQFEDLLVKAYTRAKAGGRIA